MLKFNKKETNLVRIKKGHILKSKPGHLHNCRIVVRDSTSYDYLTMDGQMIDVEVAYEQYSIVGYTSLVETLYG